MPEIPLSTNKLLLGGQEITATVSNLYLNGSPIEGGSGTTGTGGDTIINNISSGGGGSFNWRSIDNGNIVLRGFESTCFTIFNGVWISCARFASGDSFNGGDMRLVIMTSIDSGKTWNYSYTYGTALSEGSWPGKITSIAKSDNEVVAVGHGGIIFRSTDGLSWSEISSGTANDLYYVVFDGTNFIAVGDNGTIVTSSDGSSWASKTSGTAVCLYWAAQTADVTIACGNSGTVTRSTDNGATWSASTILDALGLYGIATDGTKFIAANQYPDKVFVSDDGTSWDTITVSTQTDIYTQGVFFIQDKWIISCGGYAMYTSADGETNWSKTKFKALRDKVYWAETALTDQYCWDIYYDSTAGMFFSYYAGLLLCEPFENVAYDANSRLNESYHTYTKVDKQNELFNISGFLPNSIAYSNAYDFWVVVGKNTTTSTGEAYFSSNNCIDWTKLTTFDANELKQVKSCGIGDTSLFALSNTGLYQITINTATRQPTITPTKLTGILANDFWVINSGGLDSTTASYFQIIVVGDSGKIQFGYPANFAELYSNNASNLKRILHGNNTWVAVADRTPSLAVSSNIYTWKSGGSGLADNYEYQSVAYSDKHKWIFPLNGALYNSQDGLTWRFIEEIDTTNGFRELVEHPKNENVFFCSPFNGDDDLYAIDLNAETNGPDSVNIGFDFIRVKHPSTAFKFYNIYKNPINNQIITLGYGTNTGYGYMIPNERNHISANVGFQTRNITGYQSIINPTGYAGISGSLASVDDLNALRSEVENLRILNEQLISGLRALKIINY